MKRFLNILCAAASVLAVAASCTEELAPVYPEGDGAKTSITFTAGFNSTRTSIDGDHKTTWVAGDQFTVYDSKGNSEVVTVPAANDGKDTITFTTTNLDADAEAFYAVYGGSEWDGGLKVSAVSSCDGSWGDAQIAAAVANDGQFSFKNLSSVLSFEIVNPDVTEVVFRGESFCTSAGLTVNSWKQFALDSVCTYAGAVSVPVSGAGKYYFGVLPGTINSLAIDIKTATETKTVSVDAQVALKAGTVLNFKQIESRVGQTYKRVVKTGFTAISGDVDEGGAFSFASFQGNASTAPGNYNDGIRLYQGSAGSYGGYLDVTSVAGDKIAGVTITTTGTYSCPVVIQDATEAFDAAKAVNVAKSSSYGVGGLNTGKVRVYCCGTTKSNRLEIASIEVTYLADARTSQILSFPQASYTAELGEDFEEPVLSGASTSVTYASSDSTIAKVDVSTGAVTTVSEGVCTITATAEATSDYKEGWTSYSLTVVKTASGVGTIKDKATSSTATAFSVNLTNAVVTAVNSYKKLGFIEDGDAGIYFYLSSATTLTPGCRLNGTVSGEAKLYNGVKEITSLDYSKATVDTVQTLPLQVVGISDLLADYASYEYRRIKIAGATVTDAVSSSDKSGTLAQGESTVTVYGTNGDVTLESGAVADVVCFPSYYTTSQQVVAWSQSDVTLVSCPGVITVDDTKTVKVGSTVSLSATVNSGAALSYESSNTSVATVDTSGVVTGVAAGTAVITVTAPANGVYTAATATCTVTVEKDGGVEWVRVTSVDSLLAGGTCIIGYEATAKSGKIVPMQTTGTATTSAAGILYAGTTAGSASSTTLDMASATSTSAFEVTIVASTVVDGAVCIKIGSKYLGNTNTKNNCKLFDTEAATTAFTPTLGTNDVFTLKIVANATYHTLQHNSSSPRFAVYGGGQKNPVIYKKRITQ